MEPLFKYEFCNHYNIEVSNTFNADDLQDK